MADRRSSDARRAFDEDGRLKTRIGGQALIEGVMMRGRYNWAAAIRMPDGGLHVEEHDLASGREGNAWMSKPLVRGCTALVESLILGFKALEVSARYAYDGEGDTYEVRKAKAGALSAAPKGEPEERIEAQGSCDRRVFAGDEGSPEEPAPSRAGETAGGSFDFGQKEMIASLLLGAAIGIALFIVIPALIANLLIGEYDGSTLAWNVVDGLARIAVFVFYLWLIGRMKDVARLFSYHGAEHKVIHCREHGLALTPENARAFPRLHVRCGTAFLIMVMIIAIFVYAAVPLNALIAAWGVPDGVPKLIFVIVARILLMPLIAGISYEVTVRWAGTRPDNPLVKVLLRPGLQLQYLTTNEPDDGMLECAIAAMRPVLAREEAEALKRGEPDARPADEIS